MLLPSFVPSSARPLRSRPYLSPSIYFTCIAASLLPPGGIRALTGTAALTYLIIQIPKYTEGTVAADNLLPIQAVLLLLHWIDFFVLNSPDQFLRAKDHRAAAVQQSLWDKLGRHFDLCTAARGIGWDWQVKNVPVARTETSKW